MKTNHLLDDPQILNTLAGYIFQNLSLEEEDSLDKQLDKQQELNESLNGLINLCDEKGFNTQRELINFLQKEQTTIDFASGIDHSNLESSSRRSIKFFSMKKLVAVAACFILITSSTIYFYSTFNQYTSIEILVDQELKPYDPLKNHMSTFSTKDSFESLLNKANVYYASQNYQSALDIYQSLLELQPENDTLLFYSGICYLFKDQVNHEEAINALNKVISLSGKKYNEPAEWYLALSYLKMDKTQLAYKLLIDIIERERHYYQEQATSLFNKLKNY